MNTKRKMIKATGIIATVFGILVAMGGALLAILSPAIATYVRQDFWWDTGGTAHAFSANHLNVGLMIAMIILGVIIMTIGFIQIVLGSKVSKRASNSEVPVQRCSGMLITIAILAFFGGGGIILMVLAIIALCMSDDNVQVQRQVAVVAANPKIKDLEDLLARYKQYKEDGIITEAQYKKKVHEAIHENLIKE